MPFFSTIQNTFVKPTEDNFPYVGLVNEGSTCYLNSVIQVLFHLPSFRQTLYAMKHLERDPVILALRNLFAQLHCASLNVTTRELTDAFGWGDDDASVQHDVHEMMQKLFDRLETICKGTPQESFIRDHFYGELTYITRVVGGVQYSAHRKEGFYDVELLVKHKKSIYESFDLWAGPERIENVSLEIEKGGPCTTHTVERSQRFTRLPPVLLIHPNRAEFSMETFTVTTLPGKWTFPTTLDIGPYVLQNEEDEKGLNNLSSVYELRSIVIHQGIAHIGHYFAYVRFNDGWVCFNDMRVCRVSEECVMASAFGSDSGISLSRSNERATLLVYVNKAAMKDVLINDDIPEHITLIAREIEAERERLWRERYESVTFYFFTSEESLADILDDLSDEELNMRKVTVSVSSTLEEVHAAIAREIGQTPDRICVWECPSSLFLGATRPRLHDDVTRCKNLFVQILPEINNKTFERPFFALVRFVAEGLLRSCGVIHTRKALEELMNVQGKQMKYFVCERGPSLSEVSIDTIAPGENLILCPASTSEDFVLNLLRQRKYKEVDILLIDRSSPGKWTHVGTLRVDESISYEEMQREVYTHLSGTQNSLLISEKEIGFHWRENWVEGSPTLGLGLMEYNRFRNLHFLEQFCGIGGRRQLFVALLPMPLSSIDTQRIVLFNQGGGIRPTVYVEKRPYTLGKLYRLALQQIGSCLHQSLVNYITQRLQNGTPVLRLIYVDQGRPQYVYVNEEENVLIKKGLYVIDVLAEVTAGFSRVDVVFCDRRSRDEFFGFPTNIAISDSYEETGADIAQRIAEKTQMEVSVEEIERWIVAAKGKSGTCRTVGRKDLLKNLVKEVGGELECFMVDRPRSLILDGVGELRQNSEQSIIIRNPSSQELRMTAR